MLAGDLVSVHHNMVAARSDPSEQQKCKGRSVLSLELACRGRGLVSSLASLSHTFYLHISVVYNVRSPHFIYKYQSCTIFTLLS
jgi:hypothetical protein